MSNCIASCSQKYVCLCSSSKSHASLTYCFLLLPAAIGSGGHFALSSALALLDVPDMDAEAIAKKSMSIASELCVYTNDQYVVEKISGDEEEAKE